MILEKVFVIHSKKRLARVLTIVQILSKTILEELLHSSNLDLKEAFNRRLHCKLPRILKILYRTIAGREIFMLLNLPFSRKSCGTSSICCRTYQFRAQHGMLCYSSKLTRLSRMTFEEAFCLKNKIKYNVVDTTFVVKQNSTAVVQ